VKVAAVVVVLAAVVVVVKRALKAVRVVHATVLPPHAVVALHKGVPVVIVKSVQKEVLMAHHPIASTIATIAATTGPMTEAWTAATTAARAAMSCHVTLTHS
jgi:hypothetical protein